MAFRVNQKVVCVDAKGNPYLKLNAIYTVTGLEEVYPGFPGIHVSEAQQILGCAFYQRRFHPLISNKTDVSFTTGADPESEKWDNRKPMPVYTFDTAGHEDILQYLRGFY